MTDWNEPGNYLVHIFQLDSYFHLHCSRSRHLIIGISRRCSTLLPVQPKALSFPLENRQEMKSSGCLRSRWRHWKKGLMSAFYYLQHPISYCLFSEQGSQWWDKSHLWCMANVKCQCILCCNWPLDWGESARGVGWTQSTLWLHADEHRS